MNSMCSVHHAMSTRVDISDFFRSPHAVQHQKQVFITHFSIAATTGQNIKHYSYNDIDQPFLKEQPEALSANKV